MIKFFRKIRQNLLMENKAFCHSALDAESTLDLKIDSCLRRNDRNTKL